VADLRDTLNLFARQFALALQRSTRLPPGGAADAGERADEELLRSSTRHLPGAGWLVGLLSAFVFALVALLLRGSPGGPTLAAVGCVIATVLLTGAAQESALFRTVDALEGRLPGAGSSAGFGTIALVLAIVARVTAIAAIGSVSEAGVLAALFAAPVVSRFAPLLAAHWLGNGRDVDRPTVGIAALWCLPPLALMLLADGLAFLLLAMVAAAIGWVAVLRFFRNHAGALDDQRAATLQQACEIAFYFGAAIGA